MLGENIQIGSMHNQGVDYVIEIVGAIGAVLPIYDACRRLYNKCKNMHFCGKFAIDFWEQLFKQYIIFKRIINTKLENVQNALALKNEYYELIKGILAQLFIIRIYLKKYIQLARKYLANKTKQLNSTLSSATVALKQPNKKANIKPKLNSALSLAITI